MDCSTVMAPIRTALYDDETAGTAIDFMVEKHMGLVPVTDREGTFSGLLSGDRLMHFMLPRAVAAMRKIRRGMKHASYLDESQEEMRERLDALRQRTVGELVDREIQTVRPDTPLIDALMLMTHQQYVVPVIDEDGKLLGAISFFSVLYALREEYDREAAGEAKSREREEREKEKNG